MSTYPARYAMGAHEPTVRLHVQNTVREENSTQAPRHKAICEAIRGQPSLIGLEGAIEWFEERAFRNRYGNIIMCPDLVGLVDECCWVVEIGTTLPVGKLERASVVIEMNFGVRPQLIGVKYAPRSAEYWYCVVERVGELLKANNRVCGRVDTALNTPAESCPVKSRESMPGLGMLEAKDFYEKYAWPRASRKPRY